MLIQIRNFQKCRGYQRRSYPLRRSRLGNERKSTVLDLRTVGTPCAKVFFISLIDSLVILRWYPWCRVGNPHMRCLRRVPIWPLGCSAVDLVGRHSKVLIRVLIWPLGCSTTGLVDHRFKVFILLVEGHRCRRLGSLHLTRCLLAILRQMKMP